MKGREPGQSTVSPIYKVATLHTCRKTPRIRKQGPCAATTFDFSSLDLSRSHKDTGELPWPAGPLAERTSTVGERVRQLTVERPVRVVIVYSI